MTPVLIRYLILYAEGEVTYLLGITTVTLFILINFLSSLIQQSVWFRFDYLGMKIRVATTGLIYQQVRKLKVAIETMRLPLLDK